jgi:hypothetical protein
MFKMYHIVERVLKYNTQIVERGKIDTPYKHLHNRSLYWLHTISSIKIAEVCYFYGSKLPFLMKWFRGYDLGV